MPIFAKFLPGGEVHTEYDTVAYLIPASYTLSSHLNETLQ